MCICIGNETTGRARSLNIRHISDKAICGMVLEASAGHFSMRMKMIAQWYEDDSKQGQTCNMRLLPPGPASQIQPDVGRILGQYSV